MSRKRYSPEKIIGILREAEVALAQGMTVGQICRQLSISEQTYYTWRKQYGGMITYNIFRTFEAMPSKCEINFTGRLVQYYIRL